ncbi:MULTISPECIES: restriction endonuclease subunit S [unclassified Acinetobacter]|uniref:restriction endonuclease subunit S n=1 Tax=unclassified Acinetobacter TaxID=196816 RepID=UPI0015D2A1F2|nr:MULTISPECIES: restriction endonuclease subunit S [unclassified Acinetobacter]
MASPKLRFKEFEGNWSKKRLDSFLERISNPVNVVGTQNYVQIGIRSHGKGIFHKESVTGKELGNKRVFWVVPNALVVNIVFAWERAIAVTSDKENGLIASHRFPMYAPKDGLSDVNFLRYMFITDKGQSYLEFASPGGAGRNKTLGQSNFAELKIDLPTAEEQTKIASFLSVVDERIGQLSQKHELLSQYKQGMMQKLFSQQIRFKADDGSEFGEWGSTCIGDVCKITTGNKDTQNKVDDGSYPFFVRSQTVERINSFSMDTEAILTSGDGVGVGKNFHYIDGKFDFHQRVYCLYGFSEKMIGKYLYIYFSNYFYDRVKRLSAKNSVDSVRMDMISKMEIKFPCLEEQTKIANFLSAIDQKIAGVAQQIEQTKQWKKGLLQQMFV